ncbi:hypothetical protein V5O48_016672 [Marasmius crinis-equi]|uniref:Uncharacterized protein n=1 Tax=Marasmius crinis-equi TaxID=585013 RepID=A0ABR3ER38_9AGAR
MPSIDSARTTPTLIERKPLVDIHKTLPPPSSGSLDKDNVSVYSQDSGCVILELEPRTQNCTDATPKATLTFAAIWDPERGFTTISGSQLLSDNGSSLCGREDYDDEHDYFGNGHPDCEPHLPSRFSVTTISTSNYLDINFGAATKRDLWNWTWPRGKTSKLNPSASNHSNPEDEHPPWILQIFKAGYTRPKGPSLKPILPEISESFQPNPVPDDPIPPPHAPTRRGSEDSIVPSGAQTYHTWSPSKEGPSSSTSSLGTVKGPRLPSVFQKLKRSATTGNISPSAGDRNLKRGWVIVDGTGKARSVLV